MPDHVQLSSCIAPLSVPDPILLGQLTFTLQAYVRAGAGITTCVAWYFPATHADHRFARGYWLYAKGL